MMEKIGEGANGVIYYDGTYIYKIIKDREMLETEKYMKYLHDLIALSYDIPRIHDIKETDEGIIVKKDYVEGETVHKHLNHDEGLHYLFDMVDLQLEINSVKIDLPRKFSDNIRDAINWLDIKNKEHLLEELDSIDESYLCHGDFHPQNVIISKDKLIAIDWDNACSGNPNMDVARTYLLFESRARGIGELYINDYCKKKGIDVADVKRLVKFIAIQFMTEPANSGDKEFLESFINKDK